MKLVCLSFYGDMKTFPHVFSSVEDALETSSDELGTVWFDYPFRFVCRGTRIMWTPPELEFFIDFRIGYVAELFHRAATTVFDGWIPNNESFLAFLADTGPWGI